MVFSPGSVHPAPRGYRGVNVSPRPRRAQPNGWWPMHAPAQR